MGDEVRSVQIQARDGELTAHVARVMHRRVALLVLDNLRDFPDIHVIVRTRAGTKTHGWWNGAPTRPSLRQRPVTGTQQPGLTCSLA